MFKLARIAVIALSVLVLAGSSPRTLGDLLTIYQIQYTTNPDGSSNYDGQVVDCTGGIVVGKYAGFRPRVMLQDPAQPDGWGGIQVKDWTNGDLFDNVYPGDWVELTNVKVEEYRGTTLLQWQTMYNPGFTVTSQGNPLPPPLVLSAADIPAPIEGPPGEWYVVDHAAECYESMRLIVRDITVTDWNLGKAVDNYNLRTPGGDDCWAADYMNEHVGPWGYHAFVQLERHFCAVAGLFEQYTYPANGWDYYQLVTTTTIDLAICGDGNSDGVVDAADLPRFNECCIGPQCDDLPGGCNPPAWTWPPPELPIQQCLMMDFDYDGDVDLTDFADLQVIFGDP